MWEMQAVLSDPFAVLELECSSQPGVLPWQGGKHPTGPCTSSAPHPAHSPFMACLVPELTPEWGPGSSFCLSCSS